jgi:hypothetical protein
MLKSVLYVRYEEILKMKQLKYQKRSNSTLLDLYIAQKIKEYVPPEREGVPKGDPIGFSQEKYSANLLLLKKGNFKTTAKDANVPYGLLRKWNMDERWREYHNEHIQEYAKYFLEHVKSKAEENRIETDGILQQQAGEIVLKPIAISKFAEYQDLSEYHAALLIKIVDDLRISLESILEFTGALKKVGMKTSASKDGTAKDIVLRMSKAGIKYVFQKKAKSKRNQLKGEDRGSDMLIEKYFYGMEILNTLELISDVMKLPPNTKAWQSFKTPTPESILMLKNKLMLKVALSLLSGEYQQYIEERNSRLAVYIMSQAYFL